MLLSSRPAEIVPQINNGRWRHTLGTVVHKFNPALEREGQTRQVYIVSSTTAELYRDTVSRGEKIMA